MKGVPNTRVALVAAMLSAIAGVFDRQVIRHSGPPLTASEAGDFGNADSRRHNRGGNRAAQRAALKRRNQLRHKRACRGRK